MTMLINERVVPLSEARNLFPRPVSQATLERWIRKGVRGVTLECMFCGRKRYTSEEAIQRFLENQNRNLERPEPAIHRLSEAEILVAKKELDI